MCFIIFRSRFFAYISAGSSYPDSLPPMQKSGKEGRGEKKKDFAAAADLLDIGSIAELVQPTVGYWFLRPFFFLKKVLSLPLLPPPPPPPKLGPQALPSISQKRKKGEKFSSASIPALICSTTDDFPRNIIVQKFFKKTHSSLLVHAGIGHFGALPPLPPPPLPPPPLFSPSLHHPLLLVLFPHRGIGGGGGAEEATQALGRSQLKLFPAL